MNTRTATITIRYSCLTKAVFDTIGDALQPMLTDACNLIAAASDTYTDDCFSGSVIVTNQIHTNTELVNTDPF